MTLGPIDIVVCLLGGLALGGLFFGGLWWTLRLVPHASHPAALALGSLAVRMVLLVAGLWWLMRNDAARLLVALGGVLVARFTLTRLARQSHPISPDNNARRPGTEPRRQHER